MSHLTYAEAIVTGILQGVSELFPVSSLGHNVLIPALLGGQWAKDLDVTATKSPYLAFIVGLHVATALAMIVYFRRDWMRIIRGFLTSLRDREVVDPDQRLAWMVVLGTIPVGLVGLVLQKVVTGVFAKPLMTALFLAVNGGVLLYSERQRRLEPAGPGGDWDIGDEPEFGERAPRGSRGRHHADGPYRGEDPRDPRDPRLGGDPWMGGYPDDRGVPRGPGFQPGPGRPGPGQPGPGQPGPGQPGPGQPGLSQPGPGRGYAGSPDEERTQVWNQQPGQQQWQGPDPRYDPRFGDPRFEGDRDPRDPRYAQQPPAAGQGPSFTPSFTPAPPPPPEPQHDPRFGQEPSHGQDPRFGQDPGYAQDGPGAPSFTPAARPGQAPGAGESRGSVREERGPGRPPWTDRPGPADPWDPDGGWDRRGPRDDLGRPGRGRRPVPGDGFDDQYDEGEGNVAADRRLATMTFKQALLVGAWQIAALLPGISRDGMVTIGGMRKGLSRQDAVRFSFLLSAPVILAAGVLKMGDLTGPEASGIMGPVIVGSLLSFSGAYFSVRFLTRYFSESKSLKPFGYYCLAFGVLAFGYLLVAG